MKQHHSKNESSGVSLQPTKIALLLVFFFSLTCLGTPQKQRNDEFTPTSNPEKERDIFFPPLLSFFFPGLDQYIEGQTAYGLGYTFGATVGLTILMGSKKEYKGQSSSTPIYPIIGLKLYDGSGSLSAYHAFRTAVQTRKEDFPFIQKQDSIKDLLAAPFNFRHLEDKDVFLPLAFGILNFSILNLTKQLKGSARPWEQKVAGTTMVSYGAGVGEEALFRGWIMPGLHYAFESPFMANVLQSLLFGAVHISSKNQLPWFQTLFGYHFGNMVQQDGYSLQKSIFLHFWWDILAFGFTLSHQQNPAKLRLINLSF